MSRSFSSSHTVSRRDVVRLTASGLALASSGGLLAALTGCGGGGENSEAGPLASPSGSLTASELGGSSLKVTTAHTASPAIPTVDGAFTVQTAADRAQLLVATDGAGAARGLAISQPGVPLIVDASSTALALVLLSPGLASSDPAEIAEVTASAEAHASWPVYLASVKAALPASGLAGVTGSASIQTMLETIVLSIGSSAKSRGTGTTNPAILFSGAWKTKGTKTEGVELTHRGLRFVRVDIDRRNTAGASVGHHVAARLNGTPLAAMSGAQVASIGSLFAGTIGNPTTETAVLNLTQPPGTGRLKIYVSGLGIGAGSETLPWRNGAPELKEAYTKTLLLILVYPILDLALGGLGVLEKGGKLVEKIGLLYANVGNNLAIDSVFAAVESGDAKSMQAALHDFLLTFLGLGASIATALGVGGLTGVVAAALGIVTAALTVAVSAPNVAVALAYLKTVPRVQSIELAVAGADVTVK